MSAVDVSGCDGQETRRTFEVTGRRRLSLERLDLLLLTVAKPRVVQRDGIRFQGVRYLDLTLAACVGEPVTIRDDPRDLAEIRVYHHSRAERPQREVLGGRGMTYAGHIFALSRSGA